MKQRPITCSSCQFFVDDPHALEKAFPGILILSSTYGSTRGDSGICEVRDTFQRPLPACEQFLSHDACFADVAADVTFR